MIDPAIVKRHIGRFAGALSIPEPPATFDRLTAREREVLLLLSRAHSDAEIAVRLHVASRP